MGNNKSCTVAIQTDEQSYTSGSTISGKVYLSVNDQEGVIAHSLNICFYGEERTVIHYTESQELDTNLDGFGNHNRCHGGHTRHGNRHGHSGTSMSTVDFYQRDSAPVCHMDVPIHHPINRHFPFGQYEFPFQFTLPNSTPSSMHFNKPLSQSSCDVSYHLRAYLNTNANNNNASNFNFTISNPFKAKNPFSSDNQPITILNLNQNYTTSTENYNAASPYHQGINEGPLILPPETQRINKCCCFNRGFITLSSQLENAVLAKSQPYNLSYRIQNQSSTSVKGVKVFLWENVKFHASGMNESSRKPIIKLYETEVRDSGNTNSDHNRHGGYRAVNESFNDHEQQSNQQDDQHLQLHIPHTAYQSHYGRLIQITHSLQIVVQTECCMTNPESCADVSIVTSLSSFPSQEIPPPATAPLEFPQPSAPPMSDTDNNYTNAMKKGGATDADGVVVAEAMVLPDDWSPITADVTVVPMAQVVLDVPSGSNV